MIRSTKILVFLLISAFSVPGVAQSQPEQATDNKVVVVTGVRFSYALIENWIDRYTQQFPDAQIIIESRGSSDPLKYDILAEVYEHPEEVKKTRNYLYVGRYPVLPVANSASALAKAHAEKGLNQDGFKEIFFNDIFSENGKKKQVEVPFTVYTRMQKAGVPQVFAQYFGYEQKDLKGTRIAGADAHLVKALLRDSSGVSYLPLPLIYDVATGTPLPGLTVLPPDLNGNKKVTDDERFYNNIAAVAEKLESLPVKDINNVPLEHLHLSVDRKQTNPAALQFLQWIKDNGLDDLHRYGYLRPDERLLQTDFASRGR